MPSTAYANPTVSVEAKVHHLAHLVNAVTCQLSACFSLNNLLRQTTPHMAKSEILRTRAETYHNCFALCLKSLFTLIEWVAIQRNMTPEASEYRHPRRSARAELAYATLRTAANKCPRIASLLFQLDDEREWLDDAGRGVQWKGWPRCDEREELESLCETLADLRDSGGGNSVGWSTAWKQLVDDGGENCWFMVEPPQVNRVER